MNIGTIKKGLMPLLMDAAECEKLLTDNHDSQFYRRLYVRSVFAYIEGSIWILKQVCLKAKSIEGHYRKISIPEYSILIEESYDLKNNGDIKKVSMYVNLFDNIKFTFKTINKLFKGDINLGIGTSSWDKLILAKKIRNRINHPKNETDMIISDEEISACEEASGWFDDLVMDCFTLFMNSSNRKKE
jgi:hypothetical protein